MHWLRRSEPFISTRYRRPSLAAALFQWLQQQLATHFGKSPARFGPPQLSEQPPPSLPPLLLTQVEGDDYCRPLPHSKVIYVCEDVDAASHVVQRRGLVDPVAAALSSIMMPTAATAAPPPPHSAGAAAADGGACLFGPLPQDKAGAHSSKVSLSCPPKQPAI